MTLNGMKEFFVDAESLWRRESIAGGPHWPGMHFVKIPDEARHCIDRMVASR
jgi:hypothetical protein